MRNPYLRGGVAAAMAAAAAMGGEVQDTIGRTGPTHLTFSPEALRGMLQAHAASAANQASRMHAPMQLSGGNMAPRPAVHPAAVAWNTRTVPSVPFGVDSGAVLITAGSAATITVFPQAACVPTTMALTELIAETFIGANLVVGVQPLLVTTGTISLAQFVQNSTLPTFQRITLTPGTQFQIVVTNISGASARFIANVVAEDWRHAALAA